MTILNDFLYYYENGSKIISPWGKEMIPLLLISYCPTYKLPKNHNESSSSFFLGCNYLKTAVFWTCLTMCNDDEKKQRRDVYKYNKISSICSNDPRVWQPGENNCLQRSIKHTSPPSAFKVFRKPFRLFRLPD